MSKAAFARASSTLACALLLSVSHALPTGATENGSFVELQTVMKASGADHTEQRAELKEFALMLAQEDPELAQKIFRLPTSLAPFLSRLMEDANLTLRVFESDNDGDFASLGFTYSYAKSRKLRFGDLRSRYSGLDIAIRTTGNVALDPEVNPNDFLDAKVSWCYFLSRGGVAGEITDPTTLDRLNEITTQLANMDFEVLRSSPQWEEYKCITGRHLTDQYYLETGLDAGVETDQSFDHEQYTFGWKSGLVCRGWNEESVLGKLNVLDYLPALIRQYSGVDDTWRPRGTAFPSVLVHVDRVAPQGEDPRSAAGDDSDYTRLSAEASFKTQIGRWRSEPVHLEANVRLYHEVSASRRVKRAGLDEFAYLGLALRLPASLFISYATGRLPLDASDDDVYAIGLNHNF